MSLCLVRVVTTYNKPIVTLTVGFDNLSNLLSVFEVSNDVKSYSVDTGFGFTVDKNNEDLVEAYKYDLGRIDPPSFNKWVYLH
jgi:hypothetical protein